jgi:hypothetical protein
MKKIMFVLLAAIMFGSMFAYVKQAKALSNGMTLDPVELIYNPPYGGPNDFYWNLTITTTDNVAGWEATLLWDAAVVRVIDVTWGNFMTGYPVSGGYIIGSSANQIQLGQYFTAPGTVSGSGWLATIHFTFVLPGYTQMFFLESKVWDDATPKNEYNLLPPGGDTEMYCHVLSAVPHPAFIWYTADAINPDPTHSCYDSGRTTTYGTVVYFNASTYSYDVGDVYWDSVGKVWAKTGSYPDIVKLLWEYGDGKSDIYGTAYGNFSWTSQHTYTAYNKAGWVVNLTVWDTENQYWSSTWRYQGSAPSDIVPMYRDLAIVDIWPSLPPYQNWEEFGDDWGTYWGFDSTDFWIPNVADPYWNYLVDFPSYGYPAGTTVKTAYQDYGSEGLYINVVGNNFGSVPEKATINLYALYLEQHVKVGNPPLAVFNVGVEKLGTWTKTIASNRGTGLGGCVALWLPAKNGTYLLFATIQPADDTQMHDMDHTNDYMLLSKPLCNVAVWDKVLHGTNPDYAFQLKTNSIFTSFACDLSRNGKVGPEDFALISSNFGKLPPN